MHKSSIIPTVSIVIATFNSGRYLEECILSILKQSYKGYELIIIDGGSKDNTVEIIKKYSSYIAYWISESDNGIYDAWNKAIKKSNGEWISFIGSDDLFYFNAIELYVNHIDCHSKKDELEFVSSKIDFVDKNLNLLNIVGEPWEWEHFKRNMLTWHVGCFHSKNLFKKYGLFDSTYKISGDYELLLRPKSLLIASYLNERTVKMRDGGVSSKNLINASRESYMAKIKNEILSTWQGHLLIIVDKIRLLMRNCN